MGATLTLTDYTVIGRAADRAAVKLVRRFCLPPVDRDDIRHDLLVDVLERMDRFDPCRGTLGAFVAVLVEHSLSSLVARLRRHRSVFNPRSLDEPTGQSGGITFGELFSDEQGYLAWVSSDLDAVKHLDRQLALGRALNTLQPEHIQFLVRLSNHPVGRLCKTSAQSRATLYRQLNEICLLLLAAGVGPQT